MDIFHTPESVKRYNNSVKLKKVFFRAYSMNNHFWVSPDIEDTCIEQYIQKQICLTAFLTKIEVWQDNLKISETVYFNDEPIRKRNE